MLQLSGDKFIIRYTACVCFFITAFGLFYCEFYNIFVLYNIFGVTLYSGEANEADDVHELDVLHRYEHLWSMSSFDEVDGLVLLDWGIEEVLTSAYEDLPLINSYKLPSSYALRVLRGRRKITKLDTEYFVKKPTPSDSFQKLKLLQYKLNINSKFDKIFFKADWNERLFLIRYKSAALITNIFIGETIMARGIYPDTYYDYEKYFNPFSFSFNFFEFMLISNRWKKKNFFRVNKKTSKNIDQLILQRLVSQSNIYEEYKLIRRAKRKFYE